MVLNSLMDPPLRSFCCLSRGNRLQERAHRELHAYKCARAEDAHAQELERGGCVAGARAAAALSGVHLLQQDVTGAAACAERALRSNPANVQALVNMVRQ
jgi:hypothetical protein